MNAYSEKGVMALLKACQDYRTELDKLQAENTRLKEELAEARQCIEDVCIGARLECDKCGQPRPCCCQDSGGSR